MEEEEMAFGSLAGSDDGPVSGQGTAFHVGPGRRLAPAGSVRTRPVSPQTDAVRRHLEQRIATSHSGTQERLPSSRQLAAELGVSRNTVVAAYQELVAEGFAEARSRSGFYVNSEIAALLAERRASVKPHAPLASTSPLRNHFDDAFPHVRKPENWVQLPYPFICGQVDPWGFPASAWLRYLGLALESSHRSFSLVDRPEADDPLLTKMLCERILPGRGIRATPEMVMVTMGTQGGLSLVAQATVEPGALAVVEDPGYPDARHILHRTGWLIHAAPVDDAGVMVEEVPKDAQLLYVTPSHQFPTNVTLSVARRKRLVDRSAHSRLVLLEDDYDSEFRYQGRPTPALKSLPGAETVLYLGSFSKFLAPGLRLGYLVGPPEVIAVLRQHQRYQLRHPPGHTQRALALMIASGAYALHLRRQRTVLKRKWSITTTAVRRHLPVEPPTTAGGTSFWLKGPDTLSATKLATVALARGIVIEPGDIYYLDGTRGSHMFRLGFGAIKESSIEPGVALLGELIHELGMDT